MILNLINVKYVVRYVVGNGKKLEMMVYRKVKKNNNLLDNLMILCPNCNSQKQVVRKKKRGENV